MTDTPSAPRTARERARAELTAEILDTARRHLATEGAAALSLRAVARDLGMVSSAIYRYVPSRDDLLTRLIVDAYNSLGDAVEDAEGGVARTDLLGRWTAVCRSSRGWALAHPQEWALIYGSPVPGYAAPDDTIGPASRVSYTLIRILYDQASAGLAPELPPVPRKVARGLRPLRALVPGEVSDALLVSGLMARTQLFGHIGLELDGQFQNVIDDLDAFFDHTMRLTASSFGLTPR